MRNSCLSAAIAALTMVVAFAGAQATPQSPNPQQVGRQTQPQEPTGRGRGQGRASAVFPAQQRPSADPAAIERGRAVFSVTCSGCHGADARGGQLGGPNLLRSQLVLNDQDGELILPIVHGARASKGMPALNVPDADVKAVAAYLHSLQASGGRQGAPPPYEGQPVNVVVGDAKAGQAYFAAKCSSCHSPTGDLQGLATRIPDPKTLQNMWVSGGVAASFAGGRGARARGSVGPSSRSVPKVTVALPTGETVQGQLVRIDDFVISLAQPDGAVRSFRREGERPKVTIDDPLQAHHDLLSVYTEKDIHDVTAYLVTLK